MDSLEPACARQLCKPLGVVNIALVDTCCQHALGMAGGGALDRHVAFLQTMIEEGR